MIRSDDQFLEVFERLLREGGYSAIIVPERFVDRVRRAMESSPPERVEPIIIFVPGRGSRDRVEDLRRKISTALGVEITL